MGHSAEGQDSQGDPGQGGGVHRHLQQGRPEGHLDLQGRRDLQRQAAQDRAAGGREQGEHDPPADCQEADVQEPGQVHRHLQ